MDLIAVLTLANLFFAGLLAGTEFAIHYGVIPVLAALGDEPLLSLRKALILRLRVLVPALFFPVMVTGICNAVLGGVTAPLWFRIAGLVCLIPWIAGRVVVTAPTNAATLTWGPGTTPKDWRARVDRAERFHGVGVWATIGAFCLFLIAAAV
jgi:hypothetical protein